MKFRAKIVHGNKIGRQLGFPTANLDVKENDILLDSGVYAGTVEFVGAKYKSAIVIFGKPKRIEAHLIDFTNYDMYGMEAEVNILKKISEIKKCSSLDLLSKKISNDIDLIKEYFDSLEK